MLLTAQETETAQTLAPDAKHFQKVLFNGRVLLFRNPTRQEYKQFRAIFDQDKGELRACEALAGTICIQPTPQQWDTELLNEYPGVGVNPDVQKAMMLLTGMASEETAK